MTADVELLPMPEKSEIDRHLPTGVRVYGYTADDMETYARANLAERDAELEALRAEVATWKQAAYAQAGYAFKAEARAERLAEALREVRRLAEDARVAYAEHHASGTFRAFVRYIDAALEQESNDA